MITPDKAGRYLLKHPLEGWLTGWYIFRGRPLWFYDDPTLNGGGDEGGSSPTDWKELPI